MVDLRSEKKDVTHERRKDQRLEFHCDAKILGLDKIQKITDLSLGGVFIETNFTTELKIGQIVTIGTRFPTDRNVLKFKAEIAYISDRGIGCRFLTLSAQTKEAICLCFEMFRDTLPAGCE